MQNKALYVPQGSPEQTTTANRPKENQSASKEHLKEGNYSHVRQTHTPIVVHLKNDDEVSMNAGQADIFSTTTSPLAVQYGSHP